MRVLKATELKVLTELMKDSRRSDRELAKVVGVSQPTVSRMIRKLEKEGYIREYTIIPEFSKLGFTLMAVIFTKMKKKISKDFIEGVRKKVREDERSTPSPVMMAVSGMGCDSDRILVLLSKDYSAYNKYINMVKQYPLIEVEGVKTFLIDLSDKDQFLPLTLSTLARYLEKEANTKQKEQA